MSSLIPAAIAGGQGIAQNPGLDYGGMSSYLQKLDPIGNKITEIGGDPLNLYGHKNNPNALIFPGSTNQNGANSTNGVPSVLPNLGASSLIPQAPQGAFQKFSGGPGIYNQMAAQSMGGQMFNPGAQSPIMRAGKGAVGGTPMSNQGTHPLFSLGALNVGSAYPNYGNYKAK